MACFNQVLVPTDFSEASKAALMYACSLAEAVNASVTVLHAAQSCPVHQHTEECYLPSGYLERFEQQVRSQLDDVLTEEEKRRYDARLVLLNGPAAQAILSYLSEHRNIDLVVMATHGRGGVARLMIGSVADKVVRAARCPGPHNADFGVAVTIPLSGSTLTTADWPQACSLGANETFR